MSEGRMREQHEVPTGGPGRSLLVALRFLTRLPLPRVDVRPGDLRRAAAAFPIAGVVVAGIVIAVRAGVGPLLGSLVATILAVGAGIAVTGALHEDGLADAADGLWGGWTPARRLEIMRDSRTGVYGVLALVGALALRVAALAPLDLPDFAAAVLCAHVLGAAAMVLLGHALPAASTSGSGAQAAGRQGPIALTAVAVVSTATVVLALGPVGVAVMAWAGATTAGCAVLARRRLGGVTGDVLGASNVVVHVAVLLAVAALARI
jgi:adenosylcobinamide-GDP ribazoletransferase